MTGPAFDRAFRDQLASLLALRRDTPELVRQGWRDCLPCQITRLER